MVNWCKNPARISAVTSLGQEVVAITTTGDSFLFRVSRTMLWKALDTRGSEISMFQRYVSHVKYVAHSIPLTNLLSQIHIERKKQWKPNGYLHQFHKKFYNIFVTADHVRSTRLGNIFTGCGGGGWGRIGPWATWPDSCLLNQVAKWDGRVSPWATCPNLPATR